MTQLELGLATAPDSASGIDLSDVSCVLALLDAWQAHGWVQQLDVRFARFLHGHQQEASGLLLLAAALTSHQLGRGHVCLDLRAALHQPHHVLNLPPERRVPTDDEMPPTPAEALAHVSFDAWRAALHHDAVSDGSRVAPLVFDGARLYLYRYWQYEQQVGLGIGQRLAAGAGGGVSADRVRAIVDALFGAAPKDDAPDWQRMACALAARVRFSVITGGPGTGKTTTVVRLLALLQALHFQSHGAASRPLRIRLAAPTGKAAARLSESIAGKVDALPFHALPGGVNLASAIPTQVSTLHRLLGGRPYTQRRRYHADEPLPLDVLVIDEASMVSLSDMADVVAAMPPAGRLILIGDKDQLSSVEAGAVLGELCRRATKGHYLPKAATWLEAATGMSLPADVVDPSGKPLDQAVAMLRHSHRFGRDSGIGRLAAAVNAGDEDAALRLLDAQAPDLDALRIAGPNDDAFSRLLIHGSAAGMPVKTTDGSKPESRRHGYGHYLGLVANVPTTSDPAAFDQWAMDVLAAHRSSQLLCVLRHGLWGVDGLNAAAARILHERGLIPSQTGWYAGRPVMVTRNNPALRLANGDIGVVLPYPVEQGQGLAAGEQELTLRVAFPAADGVGLRWFAPNRLDDVQTVYALTVHKSQGSEFDHAILVLPPAPTPVLTRELLYTGITRASRWFTLVNPGPASLLRHAIKQRVYRSGGLGELLDTLR